MMDRVVSLPEAQAEFDLVTYSRRVWRARWVVLLVAVLCAVSGFVIGQFVPRKYEASVTMAPALDAGSGRMGGLSSLASQYGGLASLAGLNLNGGSSRSEEAIAVLESELLTERYIAEHDLLPVLYASKWDPVGRRWLTDKPPTLQRAYRDFKKIRIVTEDHKTALVVVTITWKDPQLAAQWANDLIKITNQYLRDKAIKESERNIAYLNEQAATTTVVETKKAISSLLEEEINKEMLAKGRDEYALRVIDPAFVPEKPLMGGPLFWTAVGLVLGACGCLAFIFMRSLLSHLGEPG